ncbi:hypothetical protein [Lentzea sp. NPDC092896]|uniref:hypothetical protein n=1 Tax=Lentzea sp. NPDC092896 TaxID=3364127 RepID=UPI00381980BB
MVSKDIVSARATLASVAIGALALTSLGLGASSTAAAQQSEASSAVGISATGVDPVGATPAVSSAGEIKSGSAGTVAGKAGTFTATGVSVKAGAGLAEASAANVVVAGQSIGPVSASCSNGVAKSLNKADQKLGEKGTVKFPPASGNQATGAVITINGASGPVQTITVAQVSCGKAAVPPTTTPPSTPPTTVPPTTQPSQPPATSTKPTVPPTGTQQPKPERPAPQPESRPGNAVVTG